MKRRWFYVFVLKVAGLILFLPNYEIKANDIELNVTAPQSQISIHGEDSPISSSDFEGYKGDSIERKVKRSESRKLDDRILSRPKRERSQNKTPAIQIAPGSKTDLGNWRSGAEPSEGPPIDSQQSSGDIIDHGALRGGPGGRDRAPRPAAPSVPEGGPDDDEPPSPEPENKLSEAMEWLQPKLGSNKLDSEEGQMVMPAEGQRSDQPRGGVGFGSKATPLPTDPNTVRPMPGDTLNRPDGKVMGEEGFDDVKDTTNSIGGFFSPVAPKPPRPHEAEAEGSSGTVTTSGDTVREAPKAGRFTPSPESPPSPKQ